VPPQTLQLLHITTDSFAHPLALINRLATPPLQIISPDCDHHKLGKLSQASFKPELATGLGRVCTGDLNMGSNNASSRISVLARQLGGTSLEEGGDLSRQPTRGNDDVRPAPGGGKGTLTILDNRTGKKYTVRLGGYYGYERQ
jgi:hypothetical protein